MCCFICNICNSVNILGKEDFFCVCVILFAFFVDGTGVDDTSAFHSVLFSHYDERKL